MHLSVEYRKRKTNSCQTQDDRKTEFIQFTTMDGDDTPYSVGGFDAINMLPDEAVYKPKKKEQSSKAEGLENFMESNE